MASDLEARLQSLEKRFKNHASTLPDMGDVEPVDFVVNMIGDALQAAGLLDASPNAPITLNGIELTLNVAAMHDAGGDLKFSVFGLAGDLGASRRTDDTHAIMISFQPQDLAGSTTSGGEPDTPPSSAQGQGDELSQAFGEVKEIIGAERQQARPSMATITLNFVVQDDFSITLVAAGQAETSTTHSICLQFDRPGANSPQKAWCEAR